MTDLPWELVLIGGPHEGAQRLVWRADHCPQVIMVGRCRSTEGCRGLRDSHPHPWFWLPSEADAPHDVTKYTLHERAAGVFRTVGGEQRRGRARYVVGDAKLPPRRLGARA